MRPLPLVQAPRDYLVRSGGAPSPDRAGLVAMPAARAASRPRPGTPFADL